MTSRPAALKRRNQVREATLRRRITSAGVLLLAIVVSAATVLACGGDDASSESVAPSPTSPAAPAATATAPVSNPPVAEAGGGENTITMADFSYMPARINSRAGQPVQLTVTNSGQLPHTFTIANLVDSGTIAAGDTRTVTFTPAAAGTLTYFCTIHGAAVMSGQITVVQ
jgi:plastocyanin